MRMDGSRLECHVVPALDHDEAPPAPVKRWRIRNPLGQHACEAQQGSLAPVL
jgi:hypothetical protein